MSLEQKLKMGYKKEAEKVVISGSLDKHILNLYDQQHNKRKNRIIRGPKLVVAAIAFALLVGFGYAGSQLLSSMSNGTASIEVYQDNNLSLETISPNQVRSDIKFVKEQLQDGESALLYISEFEKEKHPFYNEMPGFIVHRPLIEKNYEELLEQLTSNFSTVPQLKVQLDSYSFTGAFKGRPLDGDQPLEGPEMFENLRKMAEQETKRMVWKKLEPNDSIIPAYTLIYSNSIEEKIYLTLEKIPSLSTKFKLSISEGTTFEEVTVNEQKGYYFKNEEQFLIPTGEYQEIKWIEQIDDDTIIYSLATDTTKLSKEELMSIAEKIK